MVDPKTILIVQIGKLGDMILSTPLFKEIKKLFPDSVLSVLASNSNMIIAENDPYVDNVLVYEKNILSYPKLFLTGIRNMDLWIDTKNNFSRTSAFLVKLFNPGLSIGYNFKKPVFNIDLKKYQNGEHATEINLSPLLYFKENSLTLDKTPEIEIPEIVKFKFDALFKENSVFKNIIVNISAGDENRYLQKEKWVEVIKKIADNNRYAVYLIGLEKDKGIIDFILINTKNLNTGYIKTENIIETAEVIRKSDLVISPDTSVIHICSAFNIPVIGIYPDVKWNLEKFYPMSVFREVIVSGNKNDIGDVKSDQIINSFDQIIRKILW